MSKSDATGRPSRSDDRMTAAVAAIALIVILVAVIGGVVWGTARFVELAEETAVVAGPVLQPPDGESEGGTGLPGGAERPQPPDPSLPELPDPGQTPPTDNSDKEELLITWADKNPWQVIAINGEQVNELPHSLTITVNDVLRVSNASEAECVVKSPTGVELPDVLEGDLALAREESVVFVVSLDLPWFEVACAPEGSDNYTALIISVTSA